MFFFQIQKCFHNFWLFTLIGITYVFPNPFLANTNKSHLLGLHAGISTGTGLFYRHYNKNNSFAWQISLFPSYLHFVFDNSSSFLLSIGTYEQFFLDFTEISVTSTTGTLFLWVGGNGTYSFWSFYNEEKNMSFSHIESYSLSLAGGPGLEILFFDHFVLTLGGGYTVRWTWPNTFNVNFTGEVSIGYKF